MQNQRLGKRTVLHSLLLHDIESDDDVVRLVHTFYHYVQKDERLNYIFNEFAGIDWDTHLPKMVDFWSNILFRTGRYHGRPFRQHVPLPLKLKDFERWLGLFFNTVDLLFEGPHAEQVKQMAYNIASSFASRLELLKEE
ncbi:MAG TPA: group III truncated hemoglobin [Balneolales bacterium]|nr:group III truncated hemoglobin [Balneolales bacterium]